MVFWKLMTNNMCPLAFQMIPILKILYEAPERTSHHIYMSLIVLLILSEDDLFNEAVHDIVRISWHLYNVPCGYDTER